MIGEEVQGYVVLGKEISIMWFCCVSLLDAYNLRQMCAAITHIRNDKWREAKDLPR